SWPQGNGQNVAWKRGRGGYQGSSLQRAGGPASRTERGSGGFSLSEAPVARSGGLPRTRGCQEGHPLTIVATLVRPGNRARHGATGVGSARLRMLGSMAMLLFGVLAPTGLHAHLA